MNLRLYVSVPAHAHSATQPHAPIPARNLWGCEQHSVGRKYNINRNQIQVLSWRNYHSKNYIIEQASLYHVF